MALLTVVHEDERSVLASARNLAFAGWRDAPQVEHIKKWHQLGRTIAHDHRGTGACIDLVLRGTPRFDEDMRTQAEQLASDSHIFELGIAHVILMPGLAGTAVRLFISTIILVKRPPAPTKVLGDLASGVDWLSPRIAATGWTKVELTAACEELVVQLGKSP